MPSAPEILTGLTAIANDRIGLRNGLGSRAWPLIAGGAGLFYGVFDVFSLRAFINAGLIAGAAALLAVALARRFT